MYKLSNKLYKGIKSIIKTTKDSRNNERINWKKDNKKWQNKLPI